ncbi:hypothetical protein B0J17DRAFT_416027 [Rhizoctonia solani]|nr:hypothetical protein B0J17DRAFT_416027 [Rhizoctonia solani]
MGFQYQSKRTFNSLFKENILVSTDFSVKLYDFSNATLSKYPVEFPEYCTRSESPLPWRAPELFGRKCCRSFETDIYALGIVSPLIISSLIDVNARVIRY